MRTAPIHTYVADSGETIRFAGDSDFWITENGIDGEDELDVTISEQQSYGQIGTTIAGQSVGSRDITITGAIWGDLQANETKLKQVLTPFAGGQWRKTVNGVTWYLDVVPAQTPKVSGGPYRLDYQFKLHAAYPYWRTLDNNKSMLGGLSSAWFPTPVSTAGSWYISKYKDDLYTSIVNTGNTETAFEYTVKASARVLNPMLWSNNSRTYIKLNIEMQAGESFTVSTKDDTRGCVYRAADGTETNGFRLLDAGSDLFMVLQAGETVMSFTCDDGRENAVAYITAPKGVASGV